MPLTLFFLFIQTLFYWFIVFSVYRLKSRFTLIPLYSLIAILTVFTHNLSDLEYSIVWGDWYFYISSFSYFTSLMLGLLLLYLFEGSKAARLALIVICFSTFFYVGAVYLLGLQVDTSGWVSIDLKRLNNYFWSLSAIITDFFFMTICWEILGVVKKIPLIFRVLIVTLGVYILDALIYNTGVFGFQDVYPSIIKASVSVRVVLAFVFSLVASSYLKTEGYQESFRKAPKNFWEIFNFRSDLESRIESLEDKYLKEKLELVASYEAKIRELKENKLSSLEQMEKRE